MIYYSFYHKKIGDKIFVNFKKLKKETIGVQKFSFIAHSSNGLREKFLP